VNEDYRTFEQVYRSAVRGLYARLRSNYDYLYNKYGDEGLKLISDMSREYGLSIADRAKNALESNDIVSVSSYLMRIFQTVCWGRDIIHLVQECPSKITIRVDECPLHFDEPEMCLAHTTMEKTVVEELNPDLLYRIGKSIPAGDAYCDHILEMKDYGNNLT
jgi:hypothetical protein